MIYNIQHSHEAIKPFRLYMPSPEFRGMHTAHTCRYALNKREPNGSVMP